MDHRLVQRNITQLTVTEVIASLPVRQRQKIPSHIVTQPSLVLAQRLQSMGFQQQATLILQLLVEAQPRHVKALYQLSLDYNRRGKKEQAIQYMQRHHQQIMRENGMDPETNTETLQFLLSTEGLAQAPTQVPKAYVENLFDRFSNQFDDRLITQLEYKTPAHLYDVFCEVAQNENVFKNCKELVDLGCGTGLAGTHFRAICETLIGVDISSEMIEKSRQTGFYDNLIVSEIVAFLKSDTLPIDVFIATDVFNYFGEIEAVFVACRNRQNCGGLLAFSVEVLSSSHQNVNAGFKLASTGRFQHDKHYVSHSAQQAGYRVLNCKESVLRRENGYAVNGYMFVLIAE